MSQEAVVQFWKAFQDDEGLEERVRRAKTAADVVALADSCGFSFTEAELRQGAYRAKKKPEGIIKPKTASGLRADIKSLGVDLEVPRLLYPGDMW